MAKFEQFRSEKLKSSPLPEDKSPIDDEFDDEFEAISYYPNAKGDKCPRCGSTNTAELLYGLVGMTFELEEKLNKREARFGGGCCMRGDEPARVCNVCNVGFGTIEL